MPVITVDDLSVGYGGHIVAENIGFELYRGDYLCIVGENGSGKSTLVKTLLGLLPPVSGAVKVGEGLERTGVGYLPQQTEVQKDFPASVYEIVQSGCQSRTGWKPFYSSAEKATTHANMERMEILDIARKSYRELSGGQKQRVLLARALCAADKLLLLDEPVSGLDPLATKEMYEVVKRLNREGMTIIMISHDVQDALRYASHVLYLGDSVFFGQRDEFIRSRAGRGFIEEEGGAEI